MALNIRLKEKQVKIRLPGAFLSVIIVALLAGAATIVEVSCPICNGAGVLPAAKGLEVKGIESEIIKHKHIDVGCDDDWDEITYAVNILVVNGETDPSYGYLMVAFYIPTSEHAEAEESSIFKIPIYVEIPAETTESVERVLEYRGFLAYYSLPRLVVETGEELLLVCPYCREKGRLPFTERFKAIMR